MSNQAKCPQCGADLPADAPAGLCPNCLMAMNLKTETAFTGEPAAAQPPLPPEQIAPHFPQLEILECLGRGGMGVVYKARQKSLNRFVALKLLAPERAGDPQFAARFEKEARALAALNHPNIVTIYDHGQAGGSYFLLMEFVDGVTLRQLLAKERVSAREALAIVPQICDALQFAHDQGIVHRDIKPENILLDRRGRVKVADFGLAKIVAQASSPAGSGGVPAAGPENPPGGSATPQNGKPAPPDFTDASKVMGTPQYMSPEQINAPGDVDHRADIYALGVVFYQMLTGELPGKKIEPPSKKVSIDVRLDEIVLRALEQKPELRFQQASILKTQVETIASTSGSSPASGAEEAQTDKPESQSPASSAATNQESRFSRTAIISLLFGLLTFISFAFAIVIRHTATQIWLPPDSRHSAAQILPNKPAEMIAGLFCIAGVLCAVIKTFLGWLAVSQIRRSAGKIHGMSLAVFSGLFFPLLTLDFLVLAPVGFQISRITANPHSQILTLVISLATILMWLVGIALMVWANVAIIRRVWRAVNVGPDMPKNGRSIVFPLVFAGIVVLALLGFAMLFTSHAQRQNQVNLGESPSDRGFDPVVERVLPCEMPFHFYCGINLESGEIETVTVSTNAAGYRQDSGNIDDLGADMDAFGDPKLQPQASGLHCRLGTYALPVETADWDNATAAAVLAHATNLPTMQEPVKRTPEFLKATVLLFSEDMVWPKTFIFHTRENRSGILQITGYSDDPRGIKLRYKLVQANLPSAVDTLDTLDGHNQSNPSGLYFSPVIERAVNLKSPGTNSALNLHSGQLISLEPISFSESTTNHEESGSLSEKFIEENGVDLIGQRNWFGSDPGGPGQPKIIPLNGLFCTSRTYAQEVGTASWNATADWVASQADQITHIFWHSSLSGVGDLPRTYLFKTHEGDRGLLQITGVTDNPRSVKLRYKLVQTGSAN